MHGANETVYIKDMELLVEGSQLDIPPATVVSKLPNSLIGVIGEARLIVTPSQSITDANRYSFQLQPNIPLELNPRNSFLRVRYRVRKKDGTEFLNSDQVIWF